jgi:deferrochelatase/peroxidase EfeB
MTQSFVTVIAAVPFARIGAVRAEIEAMGNPAAPEYRQALEGSGVHFASLNVFAASAGDRGHLVLEFTGDGDEKALMRALASRLLEPLSRVFAHARDRGGGSLGDYFAAHQVQVGSGLLSNPGICFSGTPGMTVERIHQEAALASRLADDIAAREPWASGLDAIAALRVTVDADPKFAWALTPPASPPPTNDAKQTLDFGGVAGLAGPFAANFMWPVALVAVLVVLAGLVLGWGAGPLVLAVVIVLLLALALGLAAYRALRRQESTDPPVEAPAPPATIAAIQRRENACAQNHLAGLSVLKAGVVRQLTLRLSFWVIGQFAQRFYPPGFLGPLGTIHFARWVMVPGTRDLLFFSNFGGSWESYLEDFISQAHAGLTGVWSNTAGFPRAANLFQAGATDGDRFKWWARRQQTPTGFWYSAYPHLTTANVRLNAHIRAGLASVRTEDQARVWLGLFGSAPAPAGLLETSEIQSLALGGLGFLPEGDWLGIRFPDEVAPARALLRELAPSVAFADGRSHREGMFIAVSATGLAKLGLPADAFGSFPPAFLDGMAAPWRSRILGDVDKDAPEAWRWGGPAAPVDAMLMLLASNAERREALLAHTRTRLDHHGCLLVAEVAFEPPPKPDDGSTYVVKREPFGFADGVSQPVVRGTYKAARGVDPIHLVEPGEFILGYPDGLGKLPPTPLLAAAHDPGNTLPAQTPTGDVWAPGAADAPRDLGRNGSFLAVRQLEQDVEGFHAYCGAEAARLAHAFPDGFTPTAEFISAKIVGRWPDGSALVRYPHWPAEAAPTGAHPLTRAVSRGALHTAGGIVAAPRAAPLGAAHAASHDGPPHTRPKAPAFPPDNDFLFGAEDPQATRCPFGSHIRRANPRESFDPGSVQQLAITNRHRIVRVGRRYRPPAGDDPGILFMALSGDLERQFEFVQQTWLRGASFAGLSEETDPLVVGDEGARGMTIPTRAGPVRLKPLPSFVTVRGGAYFFLPGKRTLEFLAAA